MKKNILRFTTLDSTNTYAKNQLKNFNKEACTLILAEEQTQGRGRFQRTWLGGVGNLFVSYVFFCPPKPIGALAIVLGIRVAKTLRDLGFAITLKWPNDLFYKKKKVGGILGEGIVEKEGTWIILGLGVNVLTRPDLSTAIALEGLDKEQLLEELTDPFLLDVQVFQQQGFAPFLLEWEGFQRNTLGDTLEIVVGDTTIQGVYSGLNEEGALCLLVNGQQQCFYQAEIK